MTFEIKCFNNESNTRFFFPGDFHMFTEYFFANKGTVLTLCGRQSVVSPAVDTDLSAGNPRPKHWCSRPGNPG